MKKIITLIVLLVAAYFLFYSNSGEKSDTIVSAHHKNISYLIEGETVELKNGASEAEGALESSSKIVTQYFGSELETDLDGDGLMDIAFVLSQNRGGSGTFFYAVAARNTGTGYVGSDGYFLGDRVSPENAETSPNPKHKNVVVFNYADRAEGEPITASPSVRKSAYLKLNPGTMQWGIVVPDFEGEER